MTPTNFVKNRIWEKEFENEAMILDKNSLEFVMAEEFRKVSLVFILYPFHNGVQD